MAESQPLLADAKGESSSYMDRQVSYKGLGKREIEGLANEGVKSSMMYKASILGTWEAFAQLGTTVWVSRHLWRMMGWLTLISLVTALCPLAMVRDPSHLNVGGLAKVSQFLNVIVGLLLGFFLTNSINRWYACVDGFLSLLDSVRNLQMQFIALGVPGEEAGQILRLSFASGVLLNEQLQFDYKRLQPDFEHDAETDRMWDVINKRPVNLGYGGESKTLLDKAEIGLLRNTRDPPSVIWTWIAASIGRLAQDGIIPPMPSPTYGRIMNLLEAAHGGIRKVRAAICVQTPWNYVQCLSALVHINNAINAVILGVVVGLVLSVSCQRYHLFFTYQGSPATIQEMEQELESLFCTWLYCVIGPLVYQALLLIGIALAQPFDDAETKIPMDRFLNQLEEDMCDGVRLIENMEHAFGFELPAFKKKEGP
eukprot:TRINITY_DN25468_c0_g1_i1.p1 TRINITY_DN25468_c0_g1~~TRINITY_DN25468_c0_g1_i1.p1  ORF type:complete len:425 (-),score=71.11 TRINITY_DN25468_c0_g1_i1:51-1325(-)